MAQRILTLILLLCSTSAFAGLFDAPGRSHFVPADQAFSFDFQQNQHDVSLSWQVKEGYYLYRKQIQVNPANANMTPLQLPNGEWHNDEFYGKSEIYRQRLAIPVTLSEAEQGATLTVTYQGCADAGFCYPPETKVVPLRTVLAASGSESVPAHPALPASGQPKFNPPLPVEKRPELATKSEPPAPQSPRQEKRGAGDKIGRAHV